MKKRRGIGALNNTGRTFSVAKEVRAERAWRNGTAKGIGGKPAGRWSWEQA